VSLLRRAGLDVVAEAATGDELVAVAAEHAPDVAIVDVRMPPTHTDEGIQAAHAVRARDPRIAVVILSQHVEVGIAMRVLAENPARLGYLLKERVTDVDEFVRSLRHVAAGGTALDPEVVSRLLAGTREQGPLASLTPREREIIALVAEGRSNRGIGDRLDVSPGVVQKHVSSVFSKLDLPAGEDDDRRILAVLAFLRA
jgi:DNA-binding NarL/FixJ family response regulator